MIKIMFSPPNIADITKSIANMESQETKFEAPMPSRAEILAQTPDTPFGYENVKQGKGIPGDKVNSIFKY